MSILVLPTIITVVPSGATRAAPPNVLGGFITNPLLPSDQGLGLTNAVTLYVDLTGPAATTETATTTPVEPGQTFDFQSGSTQGVWVNSKHIGHRFTGVMIVSAVQPVPTPVPGNFPPAGPSGRTTTINAYLYDQYTDDPDLPAFFAAYNQQQQNYVDTFNSLNLPIYTNDPISGELLDWVGQGIYGYSRPGLSSGTRLVKGPYNTFQYNVQVYNQFQLINTGVVYLADDDVYRRCLTWHYMKGDGKNFNIRWLKRRVMRFCIGENGTSPNIDQTYQISVSFGVPPEATIRFILYNRLFKNGALYNSNGYYYNRWAYNRFNSTLQTLPPLPFMQVFKNAVDQGFLELPFMNTWNVQIG